MRSMDMVMLALLNAQERMEEEFEQLFKTADERFVFKVSELYCSGDVAVWMLTFYEN